MLLVALLVAVTSALGFAAAWLWTPDLDRATLVTKYSVGPDDMVEVDGVQLHVLDSGPRDAPPLILLHGFGDSLYTWDDWAAALSDAYRVIRFDMPGFGLSPPDPTGDYSEARNLHLLSALMNVLGLRRATLIGSSMGGEIAWNFAARRPQRVDKLVLIAPEGFAGAEFPYGRAPHVPEFVNCMRYFLPRRLLRRVLERAYADPHSPSDAVLGRYYDFLRAPGARAAIIERAKQLLLLNPVPLLRRIRAPTLLLWGVQDKVIPVANAAHFAEAMRDVTLVPLPGLGHLPQEEAPDRTVAAVRKFLRLGEPRGRPVEWGARTCASIGKRWATPSKAVEVTSCAGRDGRRHTQQELT